MKFFIFMILIARGTSVNQYYSTSTTNFTNEVLSIPFGDCDETKNLVSLNLSYTGMIQINENFIKNTHVSCLNFSKNSINFIAPSFIKNHPKLKVLNLGHNQIELNELHLNPYSTINQLNTLILDNNLIDKNSQLILNDCFYNLENLYIRQNKLESISALCKLEKLKYLYLSDNFIFSENNIFNGENYFNLSHLYLDNNKIHTFNGTRFSNLESLQLENNEIEYLCNDYCNLNLVGMTKLKYLSVARNKLTTVFSDSFHDTINLEILDLSENKIATISNIVFEKIKFLKILLLNGNKLIILPDFSSFSKIEIMNFNNNELNSTYSKQFFELKSLKKLSLGNNLIKNVEKLSFMNLPSLDELDLSDNILENLPNEWMKPQNNLKILKLNLNYFTNFDQLSIENAPVLKQIFLQKNPLTTLNVMSLMHIAKDANIYIDNESNN
ncbi:toll-like receptor 6 [Leptopilina boulardi]|uniref:toll-like receptor 6 n=1 Tax=Leptopilina boulardi TaxID=63433 RepID=UPI0021F541EF|nr:toll-like receptor 6 [Leptopilina boulardi]